MVCPKCGSPVAGDEETCSNCGAELEKKLEGLDVKSEGLRRMTSELKAVSASRQNFPSGETIADRFEIEELVETGPFGEVYRARDSIIENDVALKMFDEDVVRTPPEREQFLSATRAARAMTQKNVVRIHDSGVHEGHPWVSMQYLEGLTLEKALELREKKGERFTLGELEPVVTQITLALQHIGREFPNGNLKPTNVFFLPDLLKITDGYVLAALPGEVFTERLGDSKYLAPELHTSTDDADVRCDVYSLGMLIGEMFFGPDYEPGSESTAGTEESAVDALCRRATAFDPAERYPSVEALSEDFSTLVDTGQLLDRAPGVGRTPSDVSGEPPPAVPGESGPLPPPDEPKFDDFPEDEIATKDYDRTKSAGDDPTEEVDRNDVPSPDAGPDGGLPPEPKRPADGPKERISRADQSSTETVVTDDAEATERPDKKKKDSDDEPGPSTGMIGGFIAIFLVVGVIVLVALPSETDDGDVVDISEESAHAQNEKPEQKDEQKPQKEESEKEGPDPKILAAAFDKGFAQSHGALDAARKKAEEKGEELEEKEEDGEESGGREGSSDEQTGSAAGRSGGKEEVDKPDPATGTDCPSGMALVKWDRGNYCIDRFEYPGGGQNPTTNVTWFEAQSKCRKQGKRLCKLVEFRRACGVKYPYGKKWDPSKCNTQDRDGFARSQSRTGKFKGCRSWAGAYDMVGNAHEWVKEQKIVGGGFDSGPDVATCRYTSPKSPGSSARTIGFRCCAVPD